jgi:hypothetical protein
LSPSRTSSSRLSKRLRRMRTMNNVCNY